MAVLVALGKTFGEDVVETIFSFVEDSSMVNNCGSESVDIANCNDVQKYGVLDWCSWTWHYNRGLSRWLYYGSLEYPDRP